MKITNGAKVLIDSYGRRASVYSASLTVPWVGKRNLFLNVWCGNVFLLSRRTNRLYIWQESEPMGRWSGVDWDFIKGLNGGDEDVDLSYVESVPELMKSLTGVVLHSKPNFMIIAPDECKSDILSYLMHNGMVKCA